MSIPSAYAMAGRPYGQLDLVLRLESVGGDAVAEGWDLHRVSVAAFQR